MNGTVFLRTSVVFLVCGVVLGMKMGMTEDFIQAPTHTHINLIGGVWMFLAGLFYNAHPQISTRLSGLHYLLTVVGMIGFAVGLYGKLEGAAWGEAPLIAGSMLTGLSLVLFAVIVWIGTGRKARV
ncbi:hypothetical protein GCM10010873_22390 [Cypionkella aquatica]|uniref:Uncharacterized protein n=1 Tax=Cypionkella aquatica TaxID=1756042 RepID=A0AA37U4S1_9RHOB|nr:hypothetical protein [Cypionkella aquatica]GLS87265.1 hypothetical protein GCM10010873_22390 [Cypionkella aquatica]